ncbi:hypothetical protein L2E82_14954 [Cichorium intybus]|uniref:Uncharacterized protein n=1 Tax=Cichorium intybus TaxID=13427 RepID=A0ACB9F2Q0_CICIN|nr:hypothetical protein L2E82_14954 [Cichorium intybus]
MTLDLGKDFGPQRNHQDNRRLPPSSPAFDRRQQQHIAADLRLLVTKLAAAKADVFPDFNLNNQSLSCTLIFSQVRNHEHAVEVCVIAICFQFLSPPDLSFSSRV